MRSTYLSCILAWIFCLVVVAAGRAQTAEDKIRKALDLMEENQRDKAEKLLHEAVQELTAALKKDDSKSRQHFLLGRALFYLEKDKEAVAALRDAVAAGEGALST